MRRKLACNTATVRRYLKAPLQRGVRKPGWKETTSAPPGSLHGLAQRDATRSGLEKPTTAQHQEKALPALVCEAEHKQGSGTSPLHVWSDTSHEKNYDTRHRRTLRRAAIDIPRMRETPEDQFFYSPDSKFPLSTSSSRWVRRPKHDGIGPEPHRYIPRETRGWGRGKSSIETQSSRVEADHVRR